MTNSFDMGSDKIRFAMSEIWQAIGEKEDFLFTGENKWVLKMYIPSMVSYSVSIITLLENERYDTIAHVCRGAIERYAIVKRLIENYSNSKIFSVIVKKLAIQEMTADRMDYYILRQDKSILDVDQKNKDMESQIARMEFLIQKFFPEEIDSFVFGHEKIIKRRIEIINGFLKEVKNKYDNQFPDMNKWHSFVEATLKNNKAYKDAYGREVEGSGFAYSILSEESHPTLHYLDKRMVRDKKVYMNNRMHNDDVSVFLVYWCLRDIACEIRMLKK